ncbi:FAD-dependent oxidoreductase [Pseudonocardia petroleophila]|uniref:ferredoxin--NADP(+) reductase n=2 Tax=Pseudonocardia petroleophila TaxID=37331 RepID=A0A7G7MSF5_9PSEU|nr:FAD-dependent oxidoreductase [Pseudonocardia petroleophila]
MLPARIAVVGAGPAGLFAAADLVRRSDVVVDVIDRVPAPFGLVRYGVAPDHPKIKSVVRSLQRALEHDRVRFVGNVEYGRDVDRAFLDLHYDATIFATGALNSRPLGVAGEDLPGSCSASDFVSWYNGHPDAVRMFVLDSQAAAVVGAGNVALDIARLLTRQVGALALTDVPSAVLEAFAASTVRDVHILCRRGAAQTKFTTKELLDLRELRGVGVLVDPEELRDVPAGTGGPVMPNAEVFRTWAADRVAQQAAPHRIHFHFWSRPAAIEGVERVEALRVERTKLDEEGAAQGTGEFRALDVGLVLSSVGYRSNPLPGLPYDPVRGILPNVSGRVVDDRGTHLSGQYVTGWLKRGPQGVIGTNKADAAETVTAVLEDLLHPHARSAGAVDDALTALGAEVIDYVGWQRIDAQEVLRGQASSRDRAKISDWAELRAIGAGRSV